MLSIHPTFATSQPNIVLILTDDQSYGMMGVTGNKVVQTPNLDELANQGVLFTNAHVSSAICMPSRVSLLLGQYERTHGVNFNSGTAISESAWQNGYPIKLRQAGYYTGWIGKNHSPVGEGGYASGVMEDSFDYWYAGHRHLSFYPKQRHDIFSEARANTQAEILNEGVDDFFNTNNYRFKKAKTFFERRPKSKPFMLSINFNLPHDAATGTMQMLASDDSLYREAYREMDIPAPKLYVAKKDIQTPKLPADLLRVEDRQSSYNYVDKADTVKERYIRQLQAMTGIDRLVGALRVQLESQGVADNTVIVFTSDHGLFMGEHGLGGKSLCYEKNTHVPLIIYDPRQTTRGRNNALVQNIDIAPTLLSLAGIQAPDSMQGEDISLAVHDMADTQRQWMFSENLWSTHFGNPRCEAIQNKQWKYIRYYKNDTLSASYKIDLAKQMKVPINTILYGVHDNDIAQYRHSLEASMRGEPAVFEELYHLTNDPLEANNLATDPAHKSKLHQMRQQWFPVLKQASQSQVKNVTRFTSDF